MYSEYQPEDGNRLLPQAVEAGLRRALGQGFGVVLLAALFAAWLSLVSWSVTDPSLTHITREAPVNLVGHPGAIVSDLLLQTLGLASAVLLLAPMIWALDLTLTGSVAGPRWKILCHVVSVLLLSGALSTLPQILAWPLNHGFGGIVGDGIAAVALWAAAQAVPAFGQIAAGLSLALAGTAFAFSATGTTAQHMREAGRRVHGRLRRQAAGPARRRAMPRMDRRGGPPAGEPTLRFGEAGLSGRHWEEPAREDAWFPDLPPPPSQHSPGSRQTASGPHSNGLERFVPGRDLEDDPGEDFFDPADESHPPSQERRSSPAKPDFVPAYDGEEAGVDDGVTRGDGFDFATDEDSLEMARRFAPAPREPEDGLLKRALRGGARRRTSRPLGEPETVAPDSSGWRAAARQVDRSDGPEQDDGAEAFDGYGRDADDGGGARNARHDDADADGGRDRDRDRDRNRNGIGGDLASFDDGADAARSNEASVSGTTAASGAASGVASGVQRAGAGASTPEGQGAPAQELPRGLRPFAPTSQTGYRKPSLNLLAPPSSSRPSPELTETVLRGTERLLYDVLDSFGISGEIAGRVPGPAVTSFELRLAEGINPWRVAGLAEDIARGMRVASARIAVAAGTSTVWIELPNMHRRPIVLRDILSSEAYRSFGGVLPAGLGLSNDGQTVVADLAGLSNVLVTGEPGTGKTTLLRAQLLSIVFRSSAEDCRFILIDPSLTEFAALNGAPHLMCPVVADPGRALEVLSWLTGEIDERAARMAKLSARTPEIFNNRVRNARKRGEMIARTVHTGFCERTDQPIYEHEQMDFEPMPNVVVLIDDLAALMEVDGRRCEASIARLAERGRAVGIHVVAATRTTCDLCLTDRIKQSFASTVTFRLRSKAQSRQTINEQGAEQLLAYGDALVALGSGRVTRMHTGLVTREEVAAVAETLRQTGAARPVKGLDDLFAGFAD